MGSNNFSYILRNNSLFEKITYFIKYKILKKYSQNSEDLWLFNYFNKKNGFYIDIGAYHPEMLSNTALFYNNGWSGINIDPIKEKILVFNKYRKRDINVNCAVGKKGKVNFFKGLRSKDANDACSSFDEKIIKSFNVPYKKIKVDVLPLSYILDKHLPNGKKIDFFDIDVEGQDLNVLKTNNWKKYSPKIILIETSHVNYNEVEKYLNNKGYLKINEFGENTIFERRDKK